MYPTHPTAIRHMNRQQQTFAPQGIRRIRQLNERTYMQAGAHLRTYAHTQNHVSDVSDVSDTDTKY